VTKTFKRRLFDITVLSRTDRKIDALNCFKTNTYVVDTDEVFLSLPHVLNQASQDHFSPFLHRGRWILSQSTI